MRTRQTKRWCPECTQMVFSLGHEHGQEVTVDTAVALGASLAEPFVGRWRLVNSTPGSHVLIVPPMFYESIKVPSDSEWVGVEWKLAE